MKKSFVLKMVLGSLCAFAFAQSVEFSVTKGDFISGFTDFEENANQYGVFPVMISWSSDEEIKSVDLYKRIYVFNDGDDSQSSFDEDEMSFCKIAVLYGSESFFIDKDEDSYAEKRYEYKADFHFKNGMNISAFDYGYGALTAVEFMSVYNKNIVSSHNKLTLMHKKHNLSKLGKEKANALCSGTISYRTKVKGFSGIVYMDYDDYCDEKNWILNGQTNIKANMRANGHMFGTVNCSGMYEGSVSYDAIKLKKGNASSGYYTIVRKGFQPCPVEWNAIEEELIANEELEVKNYVEVPYEE